MTVVQSPTGANEPIDRTPRSSDLMALLADSTGRDVAEVRELARMTGGSSREIWSFTAQFADGTTSDFVLRRDPPGELRADGTMLEIEVMTAAREAGVPVPRLYRSERLGGITDGIVMDRVLGETSPARILDRPDLAAARAGLAAQCGTVLGDLHSLPPTVVPQLPREDRLVDYRATLDRLDRDRPVLELAYQWLLADRPTRRPSVIVHGDFRLGNIAVEPSGLSAVFDWESAHLGDPFEDLGWIAVKSWRFRGSGIIGGFGDPEPFLAAYSQRTGADVSAAEFNWAIGLNTWIWAVGCLQQADRHLSGTQRSIDLAMVGRRVVEIERDLLELMS